MVEAVTTASQATSQASGGGFTTLFLGVVVILIFAVIILAILGFVGYKIWQMVKKRDDLMFRVRRERLRLARAQRSYKSKGWLPWNFKKNTPIRLFKYEFRNGKPYPAVTQPIGWHHGDFHTHEGNLIISAYLPGNRFLLFFPRAELIIINNKAKRKIKIGKKEYEYDLPVARDMVQFNHNPDEILLHADGLSDAGEFYVPCIRDENGEVIDLAAFAIQNMSDVGISHLFNEHINAWAVANKKAVDTNPYVRISQKTSDSNMSVEQHQGGPQ